MPTSSTRSTAREGQMFNHCRHAYVRLRFENYDCEALAVTAAYAGLFELTQKEMLSAINNSNFLWDNVKSNKTSQNVWDAAEYMSDTVTSLVQAGRKAEKQALELVQFSRELYTLAEDWLEYEEKRKKRPARWD